MTCAGLIMVARVYLVCQVCKVGEYAADPVLGITEFLSRRLRQLTSLLGATTSSFAKATDLLCSCAGVRIAEETVRRCCYAAGKQFEPLTAQPATSQAFRAATGEVEFHVDAAKVNTLEEGWKDIKATVLLKRPLGQPATVDGWDDRQLPEPTARCCFARVEGIDQYECRWRGWASELGIASTTDLDVHGDGAEWIWNAAQSQFAGCRQSLDPYHGYQHLAAGIRAIHGDETPAFEEAFRAGRRALLEGGWPGLVRFYGEQRPLAEAHQAQAPLDGMLKYFASHSGRMNYPERLREGRSLGSGPIEGFCKTLGLRLKSRGARWKLENANRMAALISQVETVRIQGHYTITP
jgi:hypothetical protein